MVKNQKKLIIILLILFIVFNISSNVFAVDITTVNYSGTSSDTFLKYQNAIELVQDDANSKNIDFSSRFYSVVVYPDRLLFYSVDNPSYFRISSNNLYSCAGDIKIWNVLLKNNVLDDYVALNLGYWADFTVASTDSFILTSNMAIYNATTVTYLNPLTLEQMYTQGFFQAPAIMDLLAVMSQPTLIQVMETQPLMEVILILPSIILVVASLVGLRKALIMLSELLHKV